MESILAAILGGGEVLIVLTVIMALAAVGVASLVVIAICLRRRNQAGPKTSAAEAVGAGHSHSPNRS